MTTRKLVRGIGLLFIGLMLSLATLVTAQETNGLSSLNLSEAQINTLLRANMQNDANDLSVDLQNGQFVVNLSVTGQNGNTAHFGLTMVPSVVAEELKFDATRLTINGLEIDLRNNRNAASTADTVNNVLGEQIQGGRVQSVSVTDDMLSIAWINNDPNAPMVTIQDNLFSLTFTEASINQMPWVTNPTGQHVSAIQVDLQPGRAVLDVTRSEVPTDVQFTLIPTTVNGIVTWQINTEASFEDNLANVVATVWRAYFDGIYRKGSLSDTVITDDRVTFTWDLNNVDNGPTADPVVTYTIDEAEVNAALATFTTPELSALSVDMQPGKVVINAVGSNDANGAYSVSISLLPVLTNGSLRWQPESLTINDLVIDASAVQAAQMLTQGINNAQAKGQITDLTIDDTLMTITVRY